MRLLGRSEIKDRRLERDEERQGRDDLMERIVGQRECDRVSGEQLGDGGRGGWDLRHKPERSSESCVPMSGVQRWPRGRTSVAHVSVGVSIWNLGVLENDTELTMTAVPARSPTSEAYAYPIEFRH